MSNWPITIDSDGLATRLNVFATWFGELKTASDFHDGWKLISTTLTDEFGVAVELEQCKNKVCVVCSS